MSKGIETQVQLKITVLNCFFYVSLESFISSHSLKYDPSPLSIYFVVFHTYFYSVFILFRIGNNRPH